MLRFWLLKFNVFSDIHVLILYAYTYSNYFLLWNDLNFGITPVYVRVGVVWAALVDEALGCGEVLLAILDGRLEL